MKKRNILALLLSTVMIFGLLAGCTSNTNDANNDAQDENTAQTETPETTDEAITLNWAVWDIEQTAYYQPLIDAYEAANPNVTIKMTDLGSTDYQNMLLTQLAGNSDFDVVLIKDIPGYANLISQNLIEPLNGYVEAAGIDLGLYNGTVEQVTTSEGNYYELPFRSDFWVVYYNKDIFDAAGVAYPTNDMTLDEYDALIREVTTGEGNDKIYGGHYHTWRSCVQLFGILDGQHSIVDGGDYSWLAPYYEMVLSEQDDGVVMSYATAVSTSSHYRDLFYNNKIAMTNNGSWFIATLIDAVASGESEATNWGMVRYPVPEGVASGTTLGTITGLAISASSTQKQAAFDFIEFVTSEEGQMVVSSTGTIPAIQNAETMASITAIDGFPQDENSIAAMETTQVYLEMPYHEKSSDIEVALNEEHSEIMTGAKTIEQGLADMGTRVDLILNS